MADIVLTHSYVLQLDPKEFKARMPYAPLGTLYAATLLQHHGYSVTLYDSMLASSESGLGTVLREHQPRVVVIYDDDFNYLTKMCLSRMRDSAFAMSRRAKEFGCTVVVHGSDPADHASEYLRNGADFVIRGEGEATLLELINHLFQKNLIERSQIHGIAYTDGGSVRATHGRELMTDLDALPFPDRTLTDVAAYRSLWKNCHGYFSMNMVTTRGCPFHCNWCAKPIYGQVYHSRSPENVVEEMLQLKRDFAPDHLWFCDDIFGLKPGWIGNFSDLVRRKHAQIPFKCLSRADLVVHEDTAKSLAAAGCEIVWIGAESGSQKILDAMEKGTTVEQIYRASSLLRAHGLNVGFFLQYGYPGETKQDIERTLAMVKDCRPDDIGISVSYPLPGTTFYDNVRHELGDKQNWVDSQDLDPMYGGPFSRDFYRALHSVTHKKFRIWQGMEYMRESFFHPSRINARRLRRIAATGYHALTLPRELSRMRASEG